MLETPGLDTHLLYPLSYRSLISSKKCMYIILYANFTTGINAYDIESPMHTKLSGHQEWSSSATGG